MDQMIETVAHLQNPHKSKRRLRCIVFQLIFSALKYPMIDVFYQNVANNESAGANSNKSRGPTSHHCLHERNCVDCRFYRFLNVEEEKPYSYVGHSPRVSLYVIK